MNSGFLKFIGVVLLLGSVGYAVIGGLFTGGVRFFSDNTHRHVDVAAADRR
jgi:hypothetical protein